MGGILFVPGIYFKDVSREFDQFRVNTHLCKLRCWYLSYTMWVSFLLMGGVVFFCLNIDYIYILRSTYLVFLHYNGWCWYFMKLF